MPGGSPRGAAEKGKVPGPTKVFGAHPDSYAENREKFS